uniref:Uncharacterized protein n=1 Tax=viral metagenome TaxID=1070528 RepID=A0A6C0HU06_9ZZZZ
MPYTIRKMPKRSCFRLYNTKTRRIFSKCTTKKRAQSQLRLLQALKYNKNFVPRKPSSLSR